ncbi:MAG: sulfite exporter TauE/SafE family protein [Candidatus Zixiibacteriota bacterium]|nr:MAG: sulfite exporter TauE/SafE family protein [candidate division Zixibacteria bacterium]
MATVEIVLLAGLIVLIGHFIKGFSGFASALFAIPLLALFLDIRLVVPVFLLFDFIAGVILTIQNRRFIVWRSALLLLSGLAIGTALGTYFLVSFGNEELKRVFGIVIILFAVKILIFDNENLRKEISKMWAPVSGFIGGCTGGMFGLNGPPMVLYLTHRLRERQVFRATLYGIFFVDACYRLILYSANRLITIEVVMFALYLTPFLLIGLFLGSKLQMKVNEGIFKKAIALILIVAGSFLII